MTPSLTNSMRPRRAAWLRDDHLSFLWAGMVWALIVLMIVPEGFDYQSLASGHASPHSGGFVSRMVWLGLLTLSLAVICWRASLAWLLLRLLNPYLLLFAGLAVLSVAWSIDPSLTVRRLIRIVTIMLVCIGFVLAAWHARRYQNVVRPILTALLVGSIGFGLAFPSLAIHQESAPELAGAWRGLANHKNGLGGLASITLILWFHAGLTRQAKLLPALAGGAIAAACLVLSRSSTSMAASAFVLIFLLVTLGSPRALRRYVPHLVTLLVVTLLVYALAILGLVPGLSLLLAPITALTDKDASFTGRTQIWSLVAEHMQMRPLLGSGYGAYWTAGAVPGTESFVVRMGNFYPGSAHNGYLEIANDLGFVGLACLIAYLVKHVKQALQLLGTDRPQGALYLALFFQQAIANLSESHWFSVLSVNFILMTLATTALARGMIEYRFRAVFGEPPSAANVDAHHRAALAPEPSFVRVQRDGA